MRFTTWLLPGFEPGVSERRRSVGLLTGTFDPVHLGHVAMARAAMAECALDEVWFLVNPDPEHKVGVTSLGDRVAMVRLALVGQEGLREGAPGDLGPVRHRMDEFAGLVNRYPQLDFVFIVGIDVLARLPHWPQAREVSKQARFVVARRRGHANEIPDASLTVQWFDVSEYTDASSGQVRDDLVRGVVSADLDSRVLEYIREHRLYG